MEFFKHNSKIDFLGIRKFTGIFSILLIVLSISLVAVKGLNWGLDFIGGYQIQVEYPVATNVETVKKQLDVIGFDNSSVITFGSAKSLMIRLQPKSDKISIGVTGETTQNILQEKISKAIDKTAKISSINYIGPEVGEELAINGFLALILSLLCIVVYISFRFDLKFAISAGVALLHDPIVILGVFALFGMEFNLTALAAILAVVGYSLNDTVVIYDRIRENFRKMRKATVSEVINKSINNTLSRTIMTSGLTLIVVVVLLIFGGPSLHGFSVALTVGVIVGTYSSIYVASVIAVMLGLKREDMLPVEKKAENVDEYLK